MSKRFSFLIDDNDSVKENNWSLLNTSNSNNSELPSIQSVQATAAEARYRCEQLNVTKVNGIPVSNSTQKYQYYVKIDLSEKIAQIKLEDHYYNLNPPVLNKIFDFITKTEVIRNDLLFQINADGQLMKVLNQAQQQQKWIDFKNSKEFDTEFIRTLEVTNPEGLKILINEGDNQFLGSRASEEEHRRDLFVWLMFDKHLFNNAALDNPEPFLYQSHLVPPQIIPLNVKETILTQDETKITWRKIFTPDINETLLDEIKRKYDEMHKPQLHYSFTNYNIEIQITKEVNKSSRLLEVAKLGITETIKNNLESYCEFTLRRIE